MRPFAPDKIDKLKIVIIGAGEVGFHVAQRLAQENKQVVVIDNKPESLRHLAEYVDVQTIQGSGSSPRVLDEAGIADAHILLAVTDSDEINIIACFFANVLNPEMLKLARIRNEEYTLYQDALSKDFLNIGMVINPEVEVIKSIDRLVTVPGAVDFNEFADGQIKMVGLRLKDGPLAGTKLFDVREKIGIENVIIGAIVRGEKLLIPHGQDAIEAGDLIYFVCQDEDLPAIRRAMGHSDKTVRDVLVIGGGNIGMRLANQLESRGYRTKLIESDAKRCEYLAEKLDKTIVLRGNGTDQDLLKEENVDAMDVVVSVTGNEETNILSSLLAKSMGASKTITRVNKTAYLPLVRAIGIEHSVSPRLSAVNSVLRYVRRGGVVSSVSIKGEQAEALEAIVQEKSKVVGKPLKDLDFPKGAIILCLIRGQEVIIPTGFSVIEPQDRVIILSRAKIVPKVEEALTVKLEYF
ncbi:MAG: Trk system potassium transporter TrkA [Desulfovibrio sp.]|nr:MAG: Trk system potassium transporter TrkA [Desulfovibrio sp.]